MPEFVSTAVNDFYDHAIRVGGTEYSQVDSVTWGYEITRTTITGKGRRPRAMTRGTLKVTDVSIEMTLDAWTDLRDNGLGGDGFGKVPFEVLVHSSLNPGDPIVEDKISGCQVSKVENSIKRGDDVRMVKLTCTALNCTDGGKDPLG